MKLGEGKQRKAMNMEKNGKSRPHGIVGKERKKEKTHKRKS